MLCIPGKIHNPGLEGLQRCMDFSGKGKFSKHTLAQVAHIWKLKTATPAISQEIFEKLDIGHNQINSPIWSLVTITSVDLSKRDIGFERYHTMRENIK